MTISTGDKLPEANLVELGAEGPAAVSTADLTAGRKVALFAVPGAFTPTCSNQHLPGFIQHADDIKGKGVDDIICLSVNDAFVMDAWGKQQSAGGKVTMVGDGNGDLTKAMGLDFDGSGFGMGTRSQRYSMLIDDCVVKSLNMESNPGEAKASGAETMMGQL